MSDVTPATDDRLDLDEIKTHTGDRECYVDALVAEVERLRSVVILRDANIIDWRDSCQHAASDRDRAMAALEASRTALRKIEAEAEATMASHNKHGMVLWTSVVLYVRDVAVEALRAVAVSEGPQ